MLAAVIRFISGLRALSSYTTNLGTVNGGQATKGLLEDWAQSVE